MKDGGGGRPAAHRDEPVSSLKHSPSDANDRLGYDNWLSIM